MITDDVILTRELKAESADLKLNSITTLAAVEEANGIANVTISNVAPAGVGTATISKWLKFTDSAGVVCYIPVWT